jgi:hypothetical protein
MRALKREGARSKEKKEWERGNGGWKAEWKMGTHPLIPS